MTCDNQLYFVYHLRFSVGHIKTVVPITSNSGKCWNGKGRGSLCLESSLDLGTIIMLWSDAL